MFFITRNGRTVAVTGWRAWLLYALFAIGGLVVLMAVAFLLLGLTLTIGVVLLFVVPLALLAALLAELLRPIRGR